MYTFLFLFWLTFQNIEIGNFPMVNLCDRIWYLLKLRSNDVVRLVGFCLLTRAHYLFKEMITQCKRQICKIRGEKKRSERGKEEKTKTFHPLIKKTARQLRSCERQIQNAKPPPRVDDPFGHFCLSIARKIYHLWKINKWSCFNTTQVRFDMDASRVGKLYLLSFGRILRVSWSCDAG